MLNVKNCLVRRVFVKKYLVKNGVFFVNNPLNIV